MHSNVHYTHLLSNLTRLERIKENQAFLASLGLQACKPSALLGTLSFHIVCVRYRIDVCLLYTNIHMHHT